jgi:hypothetical protein
LQCYSPPCCLGHDFIWACGCIFYLCCCHVYLPAAGLAVYCLFTSMNICFITNNLFCKTSAHLLMLESITWCHSCNLKIWDQNSQRQIPVTYSPSKQLTPNFLQYDNTSPIILIYVFQQTKHRFQTHTDHKHVAKRVNCMNVTLVITIYRRTGRNQAF